MERIVYRDTDPLQSVSNWYAYETENGHVVANWGPFPTPEAARGQHPCSQCGQVPCESPSACKADARAEAE